MRTSLFKGGIVAAILLAPVALFAATRNSGPRDRASAAIQSPTPFTATPVKEMVRGSREGGSRNFVSPRTIEPRAVAPRAVQPRYDYGDNFYDRGRSGWNGDGRYSWSGDRWWYWAPSGWLWWNGANWMNYAVDAAVGGNYRWYGGYWWYWMPSGYWVYWDGNQWIQD